MQFKLALLLSLSLLSRDRVADARSRRGDEITKLLTAAGLTTKPTEVYLRVLKTERQVELWGGPRGKPLSLIKTYSICAASGAPGPKRIEGDEQVPEGFYEVPEFNAVSSYHLAMKVSYPNASDRIRSDPKTPGGLIYMHGNCVSIGCIAIEDAQIEEVYLVSLDAQVRRIDIFPMRLPEGALDNASDVNLSFWLELQPAYTQFDKTHRPAAYKIEPKTGKYVVKSVP